MFNRWQEDWSALADKRIPPAPLDGLKYIPLAPQDPNTYLSFGLNIRERFESNNAVNFGVKNYPAQNYLLSRTELHGDLHIARQLQVFVQLQSDFAPGKTRLTPVDKNQLDVEQAFAALTEPVAGGLLRLRLGRQQFAFDLQRFISVRDGPNIRQSYDAAWADYETGPWRLISFYSRPVQDRDQEVFDDYSSTRLTLYGFRVERQLSATNSLAAYYTHYTQAGAHYLSVSGNERRENFDVHMSGSSGPVDWDAETMIQIGQVGPDSVFAWAVGAVIGYSFQQAPLKPRLGLQIDAASGNSNPHSHTLRTFNPMFPNGAYLTLAGYSGYVNFVQIKPSITLHPTRTLKLMLAIAPQWRQTTADAVYTQPNIAVAGTAGQPGAYTGTYGQIRLDWAISHSTAFAIEAVHFQVSNVIRRAGGHNGDYVGVQISYGL
ncbi:MULTISPECIES: alginate export family protein [unclassified Acidocella]|uniref:alginate export family protein n=1 Tax=unclassified Acidocella TaxID=2648610 RepID=UPI00028DEE15|nr:MULTISPECIES: alginate export family protein [unclassified Acidocella]EKN01481.1 hypothetical protein MXAZACID_00055 [Acidocella sp. MX-AZ02]WBO60993.1 alginate export family protein [Acidocella sp. MX-AZ03]